MYALQAATFGNIHSALLTSLNRILEYQQIGTKSASYIRLR
jgi:hypothetical protein